MTSFSLLKDKLSDVLSSLSERERKVLELRFGLGDGYSRTLEEVGRQFRVTRERIRQNRSQGPAKNAPSYTHSPTARVPGSQAHRRVGTTTTKAGPGLYVTGDLYRPSKFAAAERLPAILYFCGPRATRARW